MEEHPAETSKEGLRRMRRLAAEVPSFNFRPGSTIHNTSPQLIYPASTSTKTQGYLTSSIFSSSHPVPIRTPPILTPAQSLSLSSDGDWIITFHPNPPSNNDLNLNSQSTLNGRNVDTALQGGTIAIYTSETLLSPLNQNPMPTSTFSIPFEPLSVLHLYPTKLNLSDRTSESLGPDPPIDYDSSNGPTFLVLLQSSILYFYPTPVRTGDIISWQMTYLTSPINTKYHVNGASNPPQTGSFQIRKGWLGLVPSDKGVWLGWEDQVDVGITRIEAGQDKFGRNYIQTTPMPTLPRVNKIPFTVKGEDDYTEQLQGITFVPISKDVVKQEKLDGMQIDGEAQEKPMEKVGAVLIYNDCSEQSNSPTTSRTRIQVHSFERREVESAQGFNEIASGNGDTTTSWDWSTVPRPLQQFVSSIDTTIIAMHPLLAVTDRTTALALVSQPAGLSLAHLDLKADQWTTIGEPIDLGELRGEVELDLAISQGTARGQLGLAAVLGREAAPVLLVIPRLEGQPTLAASGEKSSLAIDAASSIILAERDGMDWSDVIRATIGLTGVAKRKNMIHDICDKIYTFAAEESEIDELNLLLKVQVALFSSTNDVRLELASNILRLKEATNVIDKCAIFKDGKITFDLDSIWPIIGILEWSIDFISNSMRESILLGAQIQMELSPNLNHPLSSLILIHPKLRRIVIRILSQLYQFINFIENLNKPILQPENKNSNETLKRDAMSTIVARDKIKDISYKEGLDIINWGKNLEKVSLDFKEEIFKNENLFDLSIKSIKDKDNNNEEENLIKFIELLPNSSELFLSIKQSHLSIKSKFDSISYLPLLSELNLTIRCSRCKEFTEELPSLFNINMIGEKSPWIKWKSNFKNNCLCGGNWEKEFNRRKR
nr:uncharacterized protein I206_05440 [Kwoniella pini CBS 10737]OCF48660.1 hypothetical protein I206_05440 [Kwoniella pini CBS 10737]